MGSTLDFVEYVCEQASNAGVITYKKMFGEYGIYLDGKFIACICDNQFLIKPTKEVGEMFSDLIEVPPYPGAKKYFLIEDLENIDYLVNILRLTDKSLPKSKK